MTYQFKALYEQTHDALASQPQQAAASFEVRSRQLDGLRSAVSVRDFEIAVDEPAALGGADTAPNPVEYVLAALASCQEITYRLYADALGIPLDGVSVEVEGDIDLRGFFAVSPEVRAGYQEIVATVTLDSPAPAEDLERLKETVDAHCPVLDILRNPVPVNLGLDIVSHRATATG